uniref:non-specific serine/threonine protein kinase n=1 Tax=Ditylum brightwellii TaxID=49249 RepID=A0A7S4SB02_9STRA
MTTEESLVLPPGPPPPRYHNKNWKLISQGAEARVWLIPSFFSVSSTTTTTISSSSHTEAAICKERFPKSYRHPALDLTITKSRTKSEARCLVRCRRAGVHCPAVLSVDNNAGGQQLQTESDGENKVRESSCLFLEYVRGCTVREYIESRSSTLGKDDDDDDDEPKAKKARLDNDDNDSPKKEKERGTTISTLIDKNALHVAYEIGSLIASMHNANVIHGDLTTSNMMIRNPPSSSSDDTNTTNTTTKEEAEEDWKAQLVLIDFGLAGTIGAKGGVSHEEKAVDLYVLERSFVSTHPGSDDLVSEILRAYKSKCQKSDSVLQRLSQVRLRGRKRECFG